MNISHRSFLQQSMPETEEERRRQAEEDRETCGKIAFVLVVAWFFVGVPLMMFGGRFHYGLFRTEPIKGLKYPGNTTNSTNGTVAVKPRFWVYQHEVTNTSFYSPAEEAYRKQRAEIAELHATRDKTYITMFEAWEAQVHLREPKLVGDSFFSRLVLFLFREGIPSPDLITKRLSVEPRPEQLDAAKSIVKECLADRRACESRIFGHLHYGEDSNYYYDSRNGIFISKQESFVRVFLIDVARLGSAPDGSFSDIKNSIDLFHSEKPLTNEAWVVDPEFPETQDMMEIHNSAFKTSKRIYDPFYLPILNFLRLEIDGVIGVRFVEFIGLVRPPLDTPDQVELDLLHGQTRMLFVEGQGDDRSPEVDASNGDKAKNRRSKTDL
jgi:hypothetical protein